MLCPSLVAVIVSTRTSWVLMLLIACVDDSTWMCPAIRGKSKGRVTTSCASTDYLSIRPSLNLFLAPSLSRICSLSSFCCFRLLRWFNIPVIGCVTHNDVVSILPVITKSCPSASLPRDFLMFLGTSVNSWGVFAGAFLLCGATGQANHERVLPGTWDGRRGGDGCEGGFGICTGTSTINSVLSWACCPKTPLLCMSTVRVY